MPQLDAQAFDAGRGGSTLLRAEGLTKSFGATQALRDFDFTVQAGKVHALVGENGAGKSTFIKLLAGLHVPDSGSLSLSDGSRGPGSIAFIHQDLGLIPGMTVADNLLLGLPYPRRAGFLDWRRIHAEVSRSLAKVGAHIDPSTDVATLSTADRALVAIARGLHLEASVLVLDEPTANLPGSDVERLFAVLRGLRDRGVGIIYVSHRLREVLAIADDVTVVRDGVRVHFGPASAVDVRELVSLMSGELMTDRQTERAEVGKLVLSASELSTQGLRPTTLELRAGEIVGCVGLRGAGQELVGRALFGMVAFDGEVLLGSRPYRPRRPSDALDAGVAFISGNREETLVAGMSVQENLMMSPRYTANSGWLRSPASERVETDGLLTRYNVRPHDPAKPITELSGGNAQKVVFARGMASSPKLLLLEEPTAGVDVPTKLVLYDAMHREARAGRACLITSSDHDEVAQVCDRIYIFQDGAITGMLDRGPFDPEAIANLSASDD